jgi:hypothetical protein
MMFDVTSPQFNVFNLFGSIRKELRLHDMVKQLPFDDAYLKTVLASASRNTGRGANDAPRVDLRERAREGIFWLNNIEKDDRYKRFHPSCEFGILCCLCSATFAC